jgi:amino acid transporter
VDRKQTISLRRGSDLIKTASAYDVFILAVGLISIGVAVGLGQLNGPAFYPGASVAWGSILAAVGVAFVTITCYFWSVTFPKSGGTYIFLSRGLHPAIGASISVVEAFIVLFYTAMASVWVSTMGLSALFAAVGIIYKNPALSHIATVTASPTGIFTIGSGVLLLAAWILLTGMKKYFLVQKILFIGAMATTGLVVFVLLGHSQETFVTRFNEVMAGNIVAENPYEAVIAKAKEAGWTNPGFNWLNTIRFIVWPLIALLGAVLPIGIGGEVKRIEKSQMLGMVGAVISCGVIFALIAFLSDKTLGYDFQGAIAYNFFNAPAWSTPGIPYFTLLSGILTKNLIITVAIALGFIVWIWFWIPGMMLYAQRIVVAWAFDRVVPESFGYLSRRNHSPVVAILITFVVTEIFLAIHAYTNWFKTLVLFEAACLNWATLCLVGIFFPYHRRNIFERSPASQWQIGRIPVMSIVAAISCAFFLLCFSLLWTDSIAAGHDPRSLALLGGCYLLGLLLYLVAKAVRASEGIRIEFMFREIPVD